ncbi:hypothetical protein [Paenibacillus radicis (ex Xue et al. 2023)]|uniref:DUF1269 domain-containing protein n=1 Tax=Paenibacillus radicis (ex Xue et al. 2023) TaxID=2972489 RepID=A0ABT1YN83_9BACL|nr:hypothetical protein [Paenibacillus radicis (ex Xue et al. 2023)]MCR8633748.1 hypothetical protein [Paenibacillus radicis (ex Xue et al. 2023)]
MLIVSTFEHSVELEQALAVLEKNGIDSSHILAVPMDAFPNKSFAFASEASEQAHKAFEVGMACATACGVLGSTYGFILEWGPLIWGLMAAVGGFGAGFGIYRLYIVPRSQAKRLKASKLPEVTVIIRCTTAKHLEVCKVLWQYKALTVGSIADQSAQPEPIQ